MAGRPIKSRRERRTRRPRPDPAAYHQIYQELLICTHKKEGGAHPSLSAFRKEKGFVLPGHDMTRARQKSPNVVQKKKKLATKSCLPFSFVTLSLPLWYYFCLFFLSYFVMCTPFYLVVGIEAGQRLLQQPTARVFHFMVSHGKKFTHRVVLSAYNQCNGIWLVARMAFEYENHAFGQALFGSFSHNHATWTSGRLDVR